jgi:hypothetical protein
LPIKGQTFFCLPGMAGKPSLRYAGVTPARGKTIRIARALLVTAGSEGSDRK